MMPSATGPNGGPNTSVNTHAAASATNNGTEAPLDIGRIDREMIFTPSERSTISCGTVCVDVAEGRVLIIYNRRLDIWQLPKGRKNIGEDLPTAALRETYEETGVHASLLALKVRTRSTRVGGGGSSEGGTGDDPKITCGLLNNEPVGVIRYPDLQAATPDTLKTVFFYAASADSKAAMGPGAQEEHEDLKAEWVAYQDATGRLRFVAEQEAVWKTVRVIEETGR